MGTEGEMLQAPTARAFVLAGSSERTRGAGVERATPLLPTDVGERCIGIMGNMYRRARRCLYVGADTDRSLREPGAEIPEVVGERRQEVPRPGATLR